MRNFLQEERKHLGLKQSQVSDFLEIRAASLSDYEKGKRQPNLEVLIKLLDLNYDMQFVMTGQRDKTHLTTEEKFLLEKFRDADKRKQQMVLGLLIMDESNMLQAAAGEIGKGQGSQVGRNQIGNISDSDIGDITQK